MLSHNQSLKLLHWNSQGISTLSAIAQLELVLEKEKIDVALLNETFLNPTKKVFITNFKVYRNDRDQNRGGGVAIFVRRNIRHNLLPLYKTSLIENLSIEVFVNNRPIVITSAYSPKYTLSFSTDIKKLTPHSKEFIVLGDLNARHTSWNCLKNNTAGNVLNTIQHHGNFYIHYPDNPTYIPHQRNRNPSTLDVLLTNTTLNLSHLYTLEAELYSDHLPITCTIHPGNVTRANPEHYEYRSTNWNGYSDYIESRITNNLFRTYSNTVSIDQQINKLTSLILEAREMFTPKKSAKHKYSIQATTLKCIRERNRIRRKYIRSSDAQLKSFYKRILNNINKMIAEHVKMDKNTKWSDLLVNLKPGDKKFWRISRSLRGKLNRLIPVLKYNTNKLTTDIEKANALADTFASTHLLTHNQLSCCSLERKVSSSIRKLRKTNCAVEEDQLVDEEEVVELLHNIKPSKAPGFDNIPNNLLKKLPAKAIKLIKYIFNSCLICKYFPKAFKTAKVIPIAKPKKDLNIPTSYRPISLLSNLGKLLEKIIHRRLYNFAMENGVVAQEQFGFKKGHSTVHQIRRITNIIHANKHQRHSTGLILLDIEKAFDTVWHNGLIFKLIQANIPTYLTQMIQSFLSDRTFKVSINDANSSSKHVPAGVPQGSVLSPLLYTIFTSDFKCSGQLKVAYYADDTALITKAKLTSALIKRMENSLSLYNKYLLKWKIKINIDKTQAIIFPFNKSYKRNPSRELNFGNIQVPIKTSVVYLGVILDKKLNFAEHIKSTCEKAIAAGRSLHSMMGRSSALSYKNKNRLYKCVIRPIMTYAAPVWHKAARSHLKKLQIIQNKNLKIINHLHWRYPTQELHKETKYELFEAYVKRICEIFFDKIRQSTFPLIQTCG